MKFHPVRVLCVLILLLTPAMIHGTIPSNSATERTSHSVIGQREDTSSELPYGEDNSVVSPDGTIAIDFQLYNGHPSYTVAVRGKPFINRSFLGFRYQNLTQMVSNFTITTFQRSSHRDSWTPVWGQQDSIVDEYNEIRISLVQHLVVNRTMILYFRAYDDGIAFRYELPQQDHLEQINIISEATEFNFVDDATCWWIPDDYNSYEHLYTESKLSVALSGGVNTPITCATSELYYSIHEAALTDYAGMTLKNIDDTNTLLAKSELVPYYGSNLRVVTTTPMKTPWRTVQISAEATDLLESTLILNLNEPSAIEDTSWIDPMKYMGIWWGMHLRLWTWSEGVAHGATTANVKNYIDTCAQLDCGGVLVEGWNTGWDNWAVQNLIEAASDYDLDEVVAYAADKGVEIIGHLETGGNITNYLVQGIDDIFSFYANHGIRAVKTGYAGTFDHENRVVTPDAGQQYHHGQYMVNHYREVLQSAAEQGIMINAHEPIKPTGIERTYPNMLTREGVRGQEYNAWGTPGNDPRHTTLLPFTRLLAGPVDYTPGIFNFEFAQRNRHSTLAHQLALYVTLYSPLQMFADLAESYHDDGELSNPLRIETYFLRSVPTSFDRTIGLDASIGEYVVIARQWVNEWFVGATTNEKPRDLRLNLDFLDTDTEYYAIIFQDSRDADYLTNPDAVDIRIIDDVLNDDIIDLILQEGGGAAIHLVPATDVDTEFISMIQQQSSTHDDTPLQLSFGVLVLIPTILVIFARKRYHLFHKLEKQ